MMIVSEYTPAMLLLAAGEVTKALEGFDGMNTAVVAIVVMYLLIKLILDHLAKTNKSKNEEDFRVILSKLNDSIENLVRILKK